MKKFISTFALSALVTTSVFALEGARKVGAFEFPFVVNLHLNESEAPDFDLFCNGVLIAPNKVLTAGHCIEAMGMEVYEDVERLVLFPQVVSVKYLGQTIAAKQIEYAPSYFEYWDLPGEDLALIHLKTSFKYAKPVALIDEDDLELGMPLTMVAQGEAARTHLWGTKDFANDVSVLFTDMKTSRICSGDSGGALLANKNGQWKLAGILIYEGDDEDCDYKRNISYFPKVQF